MEHYKVKRHIEECFKQYIAMFLLLALGLSSGIWFCSLSGSNFFFSGPLILFLCKSISFWECFFVLLLRYLLIFFAIFVCSYNIILSFVGYVTVFVCGITLGSSIGGSLACGIFKWIMVTVMQIIFIAVVMYLNAQNTRSNHLPIFSAGKLSKCGKMYLSSLLVVLFYALISALIIILINSNI